MIVICSDFGIGYVYEFPPGSVFLCVVDPGVGTQRRAVILEADGRWFVGPGNGLFDIIARRATTARWWEIAPSDAAISNTFHGRDLFAPAAAALARDTVPGEACEAPTDAGAWPDDLLEVVYIDHYGNCMSGLRGTSISTTQTVECNGRLLRYRRTFAEGEKGEPFWYVNANGLVEFAVNQQRAADVMGLDIGALFRIVE
ncbi:MAG: SAM-dependent chlorinase/fluorinase [Gammaproteobacteria bacterium]